MNRILILFVFIFLVSCTKDDVSLTYDVIRDVAYDEYSQTKLDIYTPKNTLGNRPVLIYIHGGGWRSSDKSEWDSSKVEYFCDLGYICVSINYRLSPKVIHPTHIQDVANAIDWVENNISIYGGDSSNLVLVGHSAGAHLAALVVTNQKYLTAAGVDVFNIKRAYILDAGAYLIMNEQIYDDEIVLDMIYEALGNNGNIGSNAWNDFAPYNFIETDKYIPYLVIAHSDSAYRCNANGMFCEKLEECNKDYVEYILRGYSHADVLYKIPTYFDEFSLI